MMASATATVALQSWNEAVVRPPQPQLKARLSGISCSAPGLLQLSWAVLVQQVVAVVASASGRLPTIQKKSLQQRRIRAWIRSASASSNASRHLGQDQMPLQIHGRKLETPARHCLTQKRWR